MWLTIGSAWLILLLSFFVVFINFRNFISTASEVENQTKTNSCGLNDTWWFARDCLFTWGVRKEYSRIEKTVPAMTALGLLCLTSLTSVSVLFFASFILL